MYGALDISTSGMVAQRTRLNVIASNIANSEAILNDQGEYDPYRRRFVVLEAGSDNGGPMGVRVNEIAIDQGPFRKQHDPTHPFAAKETDPSRDLVEGYVNVPNVDPTIETINSIEASRAYEANVMAAEASKAMLSQMLRLLA